MNLQTSIQRNQQRQAKFKKAERILRLVRQRVFDYEDQGKGEQAARIIQKCKTILAPLWQAHHDALEYAHGQRILYRYA
jgi:hypothetical protein